MTELAARMLTPASNWRGRLLLAPAAVLALALCLLAALATVELSDALELSVAIGIAGGVALLGFSMLVIRRFDVAVFIGLLLMGFVRFQPAPTDACFAVIMVIASLTGRFRLARVPLLVRWIIGLLLIVNVLSFMDVVEPVEAFQFFFITAYLLIFSVWMAGYLDSRAKARAVVLTWLIVGVISAVLAVAALYLPIPGRAEILSNVDGGVRAAGFFKDPNVFGPFLVPIAVIMLEQQISPRLPKLLKLRTVTFWVLLAALSLGVLFSYSRAAWGNYAIAIAVMLLSSSVRRRGTRGAMKALVVLLATAGVALVVLSATGSITFLEQRARLQSYDSKRFAAQDFGWKLGWTHPVGIGPGQFRFHYPVESHSTFIRTFSEQGFLGLTLWVAVLLVTLVIALRNVMRGRDTYGIGSSALLGAWCGLIFNSAVVDTLHWRHLWLVAALIWASAATRGRAQSPPHQILAVRDVGPDEGPPPDGELAGREVPVLVG
jgi:O-antigen ligase